MQRSHENDTYTWKTLKTSLKENTLWVVREVFIKETQETKRYIECILIHYDRKDKCYGHKDMDESMGPYYFDCPLSFLQIATVTNQEWRNKVIDYHKQLNVARKNLKRLCTNYITGV
jgi:hypothetical protein